MPTLKRTDHDPRFLPYVGNHHETLPPSECHRGGFFNPDDHRGKPLTERLWEDLTERLHACRVLVYPDDNAGEWPIGWGSGTAIIRLDDGEAVREIEWAPYNVHTTMCPIPKGPPITEYRLTMGDFVVAPAPPGGYVFATGDPNARPNVIIPTLPPGEVIEGAVEVCRDAVGISRYRREPQ